MTAMPRSSRSRTSCQRCGLRLPGGLAAEDGGQVHDFVDPAGVAFDDGENRFEAGENLLDLGRGLPLDGAHHDVFAALRPPPPFGEHTVRLADPGRVSQKHFQARAVLTPLFRLHAAEQRFGVGAALVRKLWHRGKSLKSAGRRPKRERLRRPGTRIARRGDPGRTAGSRP